MKIIPILIALACAGCASKGDNQALDPTAKMCLVRVLGKAAETGDLITLQVCSDASGFQGDE